jgi:hypothetical protein
MIPTNSEPIPDLTAALGDPAKAGAIRSDLIPAAFLHVGAVMAALAGAAAASKAVATDAEPPDRLLTIEEAAERFNVTVRWLRRHRQLPFFVALSRKNLRVSERRFQAWLDRRRR